MQWLDLLPHQPPMRLLEEVVSVGPGKEAVGGRLAKPEDFYFQGHFPQDPVVPAIILVEMVAQVGGLAAGVPEPGEEPRPLQLARGGDWSVQISRGGTTGRAPRSIGPRGRQPRRTLQDRRRGHR